MICDDVKRVIYFFLDGQLSQNRQKDFSSHLDTCTDCERRAEIQRRLRMFVHKRLHSDPAPDHLKRRLSRAVRAFRTEWSSPQ
jgi:mycothiol system anti-sigma-R factor